MYDDGGDDDVDAVADMLYSLLTFKVFTFLGKWA